MKIRLREIRESDLSFLNKCRNKYAVSKSLSSYCPRNIESEHRWFVSDKDEIHFIIEVDEQKPVGQVSLIHFSNKDRQAELTIFLDDAFWGNGYGKTATKLMLHYAFIELNLHKIFLHVYQGNDSAKKMYESIGFREEGILRDFVFREGRYLFAYYFGILSDEFMIDENLSGIVEPLYYDG